MQYLKIYLFNAIPLLAEQYKRRSLLAEQDEFYRYIDYYVTVGWGVSYYYRMECDLRRWCNIVFCYVSGRGKKHSKRTFNNARNKISEKLKIVNYTPDSVNLLEPYEED